VREGIGIEVDLAFSLMTYSDFSRFVFSGSHLQMFPHVSLFYGEAEQRKAALPRLHHLIPDTSHFPVHVTGVKGTSNDTIERLIW
jgi:hypothetical protein